MLALPIILVIISILGIRFSRFHTDYSGVSQTTAMKGIFAVLVVMSQLLSYRGFSLTGSLEIYGTVMDCIGQLVATVFFFYSGYGIVASYKEKKDYYKGFLKNRIFKTLLHFDIAVLLFVFLNKFLEITYTSTHYTTCWFAWGSIGNSNWFIFDILILYLISFVAMGIMENTKTGLKIFASVVSVCTLFFWAILAIIYAEAGEDAVVWYNTLLCFPAGVWFATFKDKIDAFAKKWYFYWPTLAVLGAACFYLYGRRDHVDYFMILAPIFCLTLVWLTMKVKLDNCILRWLGRNAFSIYMVQRIPMILIKHYGYNTSNYVYVSLVIVSVLVSAFVFSLILKLVDKLIFRKKNA